jgi:hypothetical protein
MICRYIYEGMVGNGIGLPGSGRGAGNGVAFLPLGCGCVSWCVA